MPQDVNSVGKDPPISTLSKTSWTFMIMSNISRTNGSITDYRRINGVIYGRICKQSKANFRKFAFNCYKLTAFDFKIFNKIAATFSGREKGKSLKAPRHFDSFLSLRVNKLGASAKFNILPFFLLSQNLAFQQFSRAGSR